MRPRWKINEPHCAHCGIGFDGRRGWIDEPCGGGRYRIRYCPTCIEWRRRDVTRRVRSYRLNDRPITTRLREYAQLWAEGLSLREVAERLVVEPESVKWMLCLARQRMGIKVVRNEARRQMGEWLATHPAPGG